jgi:5-methylcytosine-specific restriction endonuclease McrA
MWGFESLLGHYRSSDGSVYNVSVPYADPEKQREFQRLWMLKRRQDWLTDNGPCVDCGSEDDLEVDHRDFTQKVTHRVWSWSAARRAAELDKCVVRCAPCHVIKTNAEGSRRAVRGTANWHAKLTEEDVVEVRKRIAAGETLTSIARLFKIDRRSVGDILHGRSWQWLD